MLKSFPILITFLLFITTVSAQKKNSVKNNNVRSITEYKQDVEKNGSKVKENYTLYDENGNTLEEIEYDATGKIKTHIKYQYDSDNNKVKETELNPLGKVVKTTEYKYDGKLKTEKNIYDGSGKLKSKKTYQYEYQK